MRRQVMALVRGERQLLLRFVATSLARMSLAMLGILLIREFLSGVLGDAGGTSGVIADTFGRVSALWIVAGLLIFTYVGASLFAYGNQVIQQRIVKFLELGIMEQLIRHLLGLSVQFFDRHSHGDIIQAVRQDVSRLRGSVVAVSRLFLEGTHALGLLVAAVWLSPALSVWVFVVLPVTTFPLVLIARRTLARSRRVRKTGYVLFDVLLQMLRGIRIIRAYRGEREEARGAIKRAGVYFDELIEMVRVRSLAEVVLESLGGLSIVMVVIVGGFRVMEGVLDWPSLLAFLMAARAVLSPLRQMNNAYLQIQENGAAVERIEALLAEQSEVLDRPDAEPLSQAPEEIVVDRVSFSYGAARVLDDISFKLKAGETLGIVGPSGAGKSTLLNIIARFYDPLAGEVRFDGHDIRGYRLADVYDKLAIVTQEPFLFASSVRENIRCGRPSASEQEVEAAAQAAEIHREIEALPDGYDTVVGQSGHGLSAGQAQRINVARALLKNAPILLLDEATSSLDSISEARVQRAIDRLMQGRTTFIVAHRLSTLRGADRILVLDRGKLVGLGPHDELLHISELYRRMWETQQITESPRRLDLVTGTGV